MANIQLSEQDIDYIARVVATEVPKNKNPLEYNRMVGAVVDTVTNRLASGRYGSSVKDVLNQNRAFSKITGPKRLDPYGSVENTPAAPKRVQTAVNDYIAARAKGKPSEINGGTDYANPNYSDRSNLRGWINPMIAKGAVKLGSGKSVHYHGNAPGNSKPPAYTISTPAGFMPSIDTDMRYQVGAPIPTPRQPMFMMAQAKAADRASAPIQARAFAQGGILNSPKVSLNPVSTAQAGFRPQVTRSPLPAIQERTRPMPTSAPAKTSNGIAYSLAQPPKNIVSKPVNQSYSPAVPMSQRPIASNPIPAPQKAATASPASMMAAYQQYGQTRALAPSTPMQASAAVTRPQIQAIGSVGTQVASLPRIQAQASAGTMTTPIAGPLGQSIQAPLNQFPTAPAKPTLKQRAVGTMHNVLSPENIKKAGLTAIGGALAGPVGAAIGGLLGGGMAGSAQGLGVDGRGQGLLAGLLGGLGGDNQSMQSTYIGNGVNAVDQAMHGNRRGDTATYNSQGGGTVTNLGNGSSQRTSSKYGWTETTHADGSKSIKHK